MKKIQTTDNTTALNANVSLETSAAVLCACVEGNMRLSYDTTRI